MRIEMANYLSQPEAHNFDRDVVDDGVTADDCIKYYSRRPERVSFKFEIIFLSSLHFFSYNSQT